MFYPLSLPICPCFAHCPCLFARVLPAGRLEKFKINMPLINTLCNPGIKDRHWDMMSEKVGFALKPTDETPLQEVLKLSLDKFLDELAQISGQASKEYALEKVRSIDMS